MIRVLEYLDMRGRSAYARWAESLDHRARARVMEAVFRLSQGNFSNVKGVGARVFERKIDFGPGYRIYFGSDGQRLVVLLGGSTKQDQREQIAVAQERWRDYQRRRR